MIKFILEKERDYGYSKNDFLFTMRKGGSRNDNKDK
jgi:hypothetical protein